MRVGLNLTFLGAGSGGVGRYGLELARALAERDDVELDIFTTRDEPAGLRDAAWATSARFTQLPVRRSSRALYGAAVFVGIPALAVNRRLDILHSLANVGPVDCPRVKCLITVHDLIWMRAGRDWDDVAAASQMRRSSRFTVPRADRVITDSEASAADIASLLGVSPRKIDVVPLGVRLDDSVPCASEAEIRRTFRLRDGPVVLCVSQKRPYKRQEVLIRALADLPSDTQLVLPGAPTEYEVKLRAVALRLGVSHQVSFPGWVSELELEGLYRIAECFAMPSELEGFGLPVLEAMSRGVPVACSNRSALPEVAGDAAIFFDPDDLSAVTSSLARLLSDRMLRERLILAGRERSRRFSWTATADFTVGSYRAALAAD
jgi:glycosyltransferase involved in cell wall biosynthesis